MAGNDSNKMLRSWEEFAEEVDTFLKESEGVSCYLRHVKNGTTPPFSVSECRRIRRRAQKFSLQDDVLFYEGSRSGKRLQVPQSKEEVMDILGACHEGHAGIAATIQKVGDRFYWRNFSSHAYYYVSTCSTCQLYENVQTQAPQLHQIHVTEPLELVGIDLIGPFGKDMTTGGNKYVCTMVDYFTKFVTLFALPTKEAAGVAKCIQTFVYRWGAPQRLLSDQGREFCNNLNDDLCERLNIRRAVTSAYHPQTNGLAEKTNHTVKTRLRKLMKERDTKDWDNFLEEVAFSMRTQRHASTKYTPYFLMFGRHARLPIEMQEGFPGEIVESQIHVEEPDTFVERHAATQREAHEKARHNQENAHKKQKKYHVAQKAKGVISFELREGMEVLKRDMANKGRKGGKTEPSWNGPYRIAQIGEKHQVYLQTKEGVLLKRAVAYDQLKPLKERIPSNVNSFPGENRAEDQQGLFPDSKPVSTSEFSLGLDHHHDIPLALVEKGLFTLTFTGGLSVTPRSLEKLAPKEWLDDSIVHTFLGIVAHFRNAVVLPCFLLEKLESGKDMENFWFAPQILMSVVDWILFPVCQSNHWLLLVMDVANRRVHILDSLPLEERRQRLFDLWMSFLKRRADVSPGDLPIERWELGHLTSEVQNGGDDCGVYVCMNADSMVRHGQPAQGVQLSAAARGHIYCTIVAYGHIDMGQL